MVPFNSLSISNVAANEIFANAAIRESSRHVVASRCTLENVYTWTPRPSNCHRFSKTRNEETAVKQGPIANEACSPSSLLGHDMCYGVCVPIGC